MSGPIQNQPGPFTPWASTADGESSAEPNSSSASPANSSSSSSTSTPPATPSPACCGGEIMTHQPPQASMPKAPEASTSSEPVVGESTAGQDHLVKKHQKSTGGATWMPPTEPKDFRPEASFGVKDGYAFGSVSLVKGVSHVGAEGEVVTYSRKHGSQNEVDITGARVRRAISEVPGLSVSGELVRARSNVGIHNEDGSTGFNIGATVTAAQKTAHYDPGDGNSGHLGIGIGAGAAFSVGTRDADADGKEEVCVSASVFMVSGGICWESSD